MEERLKMLQAALVGINLTEAEQRVIDWLAGWDHFTVDQILSILEKIKEDKHESNRNS